LNLDGDGLIDFWIGAFGVAELLAEEADVEIDLDESTFCGEFANHFVGHVARMIAESTAIRMRRDDWRFAGGENVVEGFVADMGDVDHHAEAVHFGDDLLAERAEAVVEGFVGRGVGPLAIAAVRERHVADTLVRKSAEDGEVAVDHVAALDTEEDGDFVLSAGGSDLFRGGGEGELVGILFDLGLNGFDLFFSALDGNRPADFAGHPNSEKDGVDATVFHARDVDASLFVARGEVEVAVDQALGGVDVCVDDDGREMELASFRGDAGLSRLAGHCAWAEDK
jgi:hypothetical protein